MLAEGKMQMFHLRAWRPKCAVETLVLVTSVFFALFSNGLFWKSAMAVQPGSLRLAISLSMSLVGIHGLLLGIMVWRWNAKVILSVLLTATALATHYMSSFHVYFDVSMLRNVLATDFKESRELMTPALVGPVVLLALIPILLLSRVQLVRRPVGQTLAWRTGFLILCALLVAGGALLSFQDLAALMRNQREVRYLVTPANYLVGLPRALRSATPVKPAAKLPIGMDAVAVARGSDSRPRLLMLVVGETARAQNWGLNGYARQTTPLLSEIGVVNFPNMHACGTNTGVSVPCMFSPFGRSAYDEDKIRKHQSLLHVLERAGISTLWRDNQAGCKGVCDGLPMQDMGKSNDALLCRGARCLDEILLDDFANQVRAEPGDRVVVLHQLGNHGPSYFERYPQTHRIFTPTCDTPNLGQCSREQILNSYDNALLYTDYFLARAIDTLKEMEDYDTAMIYVSDHGESLGEKGLYLHGVPYSIAPSEQTSVPMAMWFSRSFLHNRQIDLDCLHKRSKDYTDHDNLFPSVLGLLQVQTSLYDRERDIFAGCAN
jgi:lipid A ethanolaminephosphotransferase